ncbi:hypothetical protein [Limosilactobacillus caccae]|uniref:hypothetical protein n=1 Tax=Limosilactobacillus caccae TaxID=1926284 RepID=UPI0009709FB5|nr:hypothetical protein [Limosilactobacillus caccae]
MTDEQQRAHDFAIAFVQTLMSQMSASEMRDVLKELADPDTNNDMESVYTLAYNGFIKKLRMRNQK